jgi:ABC-type Co2+ transport system permease subunit
MDGDLEDTWLMDSGYSQHMIRNKKWFSSLIFLSHMEYVTFGDDKKGTVLGMTFGDTAHVLIVVIVSHVGLVFLLEGPTLTLSRDTWMVHIFLIVVHVPLSQVVRCKGL